MALGWKTVDNIEGPPGPPGEQGEPGEVTQEWAIMFNSGNLNQARPAYPFIMWVGTGGFPANAIPTDLIVRLDIIT